MTRFMAGTMKFSAIITMAAMLLTLAPMSVFAASVGVTVNKTSVTAEVSEKINFVVSSILTEEVSTDGTYFSVTDGGGGGEYYNGNSQNGSCSNADADGQFAISQTKAFCYSNNVPGVYTLTVQLLTGQNGDPIGDPKTVLVTVNDAQPVIVNPNVDICHATQADKNPYNLISTDAKSVVNLPNGHDDHLDGGLDDVGDIIEPFDYDFDGSGVIHYPGLNWDTVFSNGLTGEQIHNGGLCDGRPANKSADLAIVKEVSTTTPVVGTNIVYTLTVTNNGADDATGVIVSDELPVGMSYVSATIAPAVMSPLTWNVGSLANGASWSVAVTVAVASDAGVVSITNTATVIGSIEDLVLDNNTDSATVRTIVPPNLGCTDVDAFNFDQSAEQDDGSCVYEVAVNKVIVGKTEAQLTDFSFSVDSGTSTTSFNASGTATILLKNGSYTIAESDAPGFVVTYDNCAPLVVNGAPASCTITNRPESEPAPTCTVTIASDTTDYVVEKDALAKALTFVHPGWTASIPGATWIWGDNPVVNPVTNETQTFRKQFGFVGNVTSAVLYVASDNMNSIDYNASFVGVNGAENNFQLATQDSYDVTSLVTQGNNELNITVTNKGVTGSQPSGNPAGLLYKLEITGEVTSDGDCSVPYVPPQPEVDTYIIQGYVWHDDNRNELWDGVDTDEQEELIENSLAGWMVHITNGEDEYSTTTDETGYYYFEVPAGTWTITEIVEEGWERTTQESHVVTVPEVAVNRNWLLDLLLPVAQAAIVGAVGDFNFGNDTIDTVVTPPTTTSGGGGSRSSGGRPRVLGVNDTPQPTPLVLGEQVSVVPVGAPDTGRGGAAPQRGVTFTLGQLLLARREEE